MQMVKLKIYLEQSIDTLTREQEKFRKQLANTFSGTPFAPLEEQIRRNMELFQQTFSMFKPFVPPRAGVRSRPRSWRRRRSQPPTGQAIDDLRRPDEGHAGNTTSSAYPKEPKKEK